MEETNKQKYLELLSEIIDKQTVILGPDISVLRARSVIGIQVSNEGKVIDYTGDPQVLIQKLIDSYVELSGMIVKNALSSVFARYPEFNKTNKI